MGFREPASKRVGLKVMSMGPSGSGKTVFALSFPKAAALDGENGMSLYEGTPRGKNLILIDNTQSYQDLEDSIEYVVDYHEEKGIETVIVDSETKFYDNIQEVLMNVEEKRAKKNGKDILNTNISQRAWGKIKQISSKLQNAKIDLTSTGVNFVSIVQEKEVKEKQGDSFVVTGYTPNMAKGAVYDYDLVLAHYTEEDAKGNVHYFARVVKDRSETYKRGDVIENPTYGLWADRVELNKDKESLNTDYSTRIEKDKEVYEAEQDEEDKTLTERMTDLIKNASDEDKLAIKEAMKKEKITSFEGLTAKKQEALNEILKTFSK